MIVPKDILFLVCVYVVSSLFSNSIIYYLVNNRTTEFISIHLVAMLGILFQKLWLKRVIVV
jgi:hypothetical protein